MATASLTLSAGRRGSALMRWIEAFAASFSWALEVRRRCDREAAGGRRIDGDAIRRIAAESDAALARR